MIWRSKNSRLYADSNSDPSVAQSITGHSRCLCSNVYKSESLYVTECVVLDAETQPTPKLSAAFIAFWSTSDLGLSSVTPRKLTTREAWERRQWLSKATLSVVRQRRELSCSVPEQRVSRAVPAILEHSKGESNMLMLQTIARTDQVTTVAYTMRLPSILLLIPYYFCTKPDAVPPFVI
jgi:hypothetical protein